MWEKFPPIVKNYTGWKNSIQKGRFMGKKIPILGNNFPKHRQINGIKKASQREASQIFGNIY